MATGAEAATAATAAITTAGRAPTKTSGAPVVRGLGAFVMGVALGATGCGSEKPAAQVDTAPAPAEVATPAEVAPAKPSKKGELEAMLGKALADSDVVSALALADQVAKDEPELKLQAARLRLVAVARAAALGKADALGVGDVEAQLRQALAATDGANAAEAEPVAKAARALLGILTEAKESVSVGELHGMLAGSGPETNAVKDALAVSFKAAGIWLENTGFAQFVQEFGPHTCEGCGVVPEAEAPAMLACAAATEAIFCEGLIAKRESLGAAATAPGNQVMLAALSLAEKIGVEVKDTVLPVATPVGRALDVGKDGLSAQRPPLMVLAMNTEGLQLGLRAVVGGGARKGPAEVALEAAPVLPMASLLEAKAEESGAIAGVSDRVVSVRDAVRGANELAAVGNADEVLVAVDPQVPAAALAKAIDGVKAAGVEALRLARGGQGGEAMPAHWREVPAELAKALTPAWERPMVVVVSAAAIDVYAPDGAREGAVAPGPEAQAKLPTSVEQGWRGEKLVRLRVPRPPAGAGVDTLDATVLKNLGEAVRVLAELAVGGRLVHVVAGEESSAGEVLRVGRHLQEGGVMTGPLDEPEKVWAGARCVAPGCAQAVPVLLSRAAVPNARGLKDKPDKGDKKPVEKPAPGPAPSAEFCNAADIKVQMAKKTASFRFCYERELQLEKDIEGRVTMGFVIGLSGAVKSVKVSNNALGSAKVADCLSKEIAKIQFKAPDGGECVVQWPFNFRKN